MLSEIIVPDVSSVGTFVVVFLGFSVGTFVTETVVRGSSVPPEL